MYSWSHEHIKTRILTFIFTNDKRRKTRSYL
nr:MAG TPA: hypothetical protein [Caudoviricetes sp.]